jgi:sarcosine oxidase subunit beta
MFFFEKKNQKTFADEQPRPTRMSAHVAIIGGGVTGLSAGWWLARAGHRVTVFERFIVGWEASGRNGGGATHYQSPLFHEEQRLWPQMDELLGYPTEYQRERIIINFTPEEQARYRHMAQLTTAMGYTTEQLDPVQLRELAPLAGENALSAQYNHFGGHANPQRTVQAYAWALQDHGGQILQHTAVDGFTTANGQVTGIVAGGTTHGCDAVVIAAGPQTAALLQHFDIDLPLASARAEMIVTEPLPLMPIGGVDGNGLYGRQTLRGNLAYGGGPHEWLDDSDYQQPARPSTPLLRDIAQRLATMFPRAAHARVIRSWAGIIENTPDGRPVIDRLAAPANVTVATMSSVGFGLSPATGHAIADLVTTGTCSFADISKLGIGRFAGLPADWRAARGWVTAS